MADPATTMIYVLELVVGTPQDDLQALILYFGAVVMSLILIYGMFSLFHLIARLGRV